MKSPVPHYNGRYGYYLPCHRGEIKLLNKQTLADYLSKYKLNQSDIIDDAKGGK